MASRSLGARTAAVLIVALMLTIGGASGSPRISDAADARTIALGISSLPYDDLSSVDRVTRDLGRPPAIWSIWSDWSGPNPRFTRHLADGLRDRGIVPMVFWSPNDYPSTDFKWLDLLAGKYDAYMRQWAQDAKDWGGNIILRFAHEADGNWFTWGVGRGGNTASQFVQAWRYVWNLFRGPGGVGATNVKFLWSPLNPKPAWYPGDAYTDYIGFSTFNWGLPRGWDSMAAALNNRMNNAMAVSTKPIIVAELASSSIGGDKAKWITNGYPLAFDTYPQLKSIVYFDVNTLPAQVDWRLVTPPAAQAAYRNLLTQARFQGTMTVPKVGLTLPPTNDGTVAPSLTSSDQDGAGIAGWFLSESPVTPAQTATGWSPSPPTSFALSAGDGVKTVYAWVKDLNGVVSARASATTTTTRPVQTPAPTPTPTPTPAPTQTPAPTPTPPPTPPPTGNEIIRDDFSRTNFSGFGSAPIGGAYKQSTADFLVNGQAGGIRLRGGITPSALLSRTAASAALSVAFQVPVVPQGTGSVWFYVVARRTAVGDEYRVKAQVDPGGRMRFGVSRVIAGVETNVAPMVEIPGLSYLPGHWIRLQARLTGAAPTTWSVRAWDSAAPEPTTWPINLTDGTAALQGPGTFGLKAYTSRTLTNLPLLLMVDDFVVQDTATSNAYVSDAFTRNVTGGLGTAPVGGLYSVNSAPNFTVNGQTALISIAAGSTRDASLRSALARDVKLAISLRLPSLPQGTGSLWFYAVARRASAGNEYRAKLHIDPNGRLRIGISRVVGDMEQNVVPEVDIPGLTAIAGHSYRLRLSITGTAPTTLRLRVWDTSGAEPSTWQLSVTDASAALQGPGWVALRAYMSSGITNGPLTLELDDYVVTAAQ
jgi:hypothetical protein